MTRSLLPWQRAYSPTLEEVGDVRCDWATIANGLAKTRNPEFFSYTEEGGVLQGGDRGS